MAIVNFAEFLYQELQNTHRVFLEFPKRRTLETTSARRNDLLMVVPRGQSIAEFLHAELGRRLMNRNVVRGIGGCRVLAFAKRGTQQTFSKYDAWQN